MQRAVDATGCEVGRDADGASGLHQGCTVQHPCWSPACRRARRRGSEGPTAAGCPGDRGAPRGGAGVGAGGEGSGAGVGTRGGGTGSVRDVAGVSCRGGRGAGAGDGGAAAEGAGGAGGARRDVRARGRRRGGRERWGGRGDSPVQGAGERARGAKGCSSCSDD